MVGSSSSRAASATLLRFSPSARALHWALALPTLALLVSGLPLLFPALRGWVRGYDAQMGLRLHLALSVFLLAPFFVLLLGDRRRLRVEGGGLLRLAGGDWRWLPRMPALLLGGRYTAEGVGRYNAGQKLNAWGVLISLAGLTFSGVLLWLETPITLLPALRWLHDALTLVLGMLLVGHIVLATLHPRTRPALRGMLDGNVPADWAAIHYPRWTAERERRRP